MSDLENLEQIAENQLKSVLATTDNVKEKLQKISKIIVFREMREIDFEIMGSACIVKLAMRKRNFSSKKICSII